MEIILAVFILMLVLMLAVPSLSGVLADQRLRRSLNRFDELVSKAHEQSVAEHRPYLVVVGAKSVEVRPEVVTKEDDPAPIAELPLENRDSLTINFPASVIKEPPAEWIFWPSGVCEPAVIEYLGRNGSWTVTYSALSARPEITKYAPR